MTELGIQVLDDLEAEFDRVAAAHEGRSPRWRRVRAASARVPAIALSAFAVLAAGFYAVPVTRAAVDDLTGVFVAWLGGSDEQAPGRALQPGDDAPEWLNVTGTRVLAETDGVKLYAQRVQRGDTDVLEFALNRSIRVSWETVEAWRRRFAGHAVVLFGPADRGQGRMLDERGRAALTGVTAHSVDRLEFRYREGPPLVVYNETDGFIALVDASRPLRELVAYDASGNELEELNVDHLDLRVLCEQEPVCPTG